MIAFPSFFFPKGDDFRGSSGCLSVRKTECENMVDYKSKELAPESEFFPLRPTSMRKTKSFTGLPPWQGYPFPLKESDHFRTVVYSGL